MTTIDRDARPRDEWYTPPWIFDALGLRFDLDVCAPAERLAWIPSRFHYDVTVDGLTSPWHDTVWMNPPYSGGQATEWMRLIVEHGNGVALVFARTGASWFQNSAARAGSMCFIRDRVAFVGRDGKPLSSGRPSQSSVLMGFGEIASAAVRRCGLGWCP